MTIRTTRLWGNLLIIQIVQLDDNFVVMILIIHSKDNFSCGHCAHPVVEDIFSCEDRDGTTVEQFWL